LSPKHEVTHFNSPLNSETSHRRDFPPHNTRYDGLHPNNPPLFIGPPTHRPPCNWPPQSGAPPLGNSPQNTCISQEHGATKPSHVLRGQPCSHGLQADNHTPQSCGTKPVMQKARSVSGILKHVSQFDTPSSLRSAATRHVRFASADKIDSKVICSFSKPI